MAKITVIPAATAQNAALPELNRKKRRVAGYGRVSTGSDEQFTSFSAQVEYYTNLIKANPEWEVADLRSAVTAICQEVVGEYGEYAASIACDLYDSCMGMNFPKAEMWKGDNSKKVEKAVRYQIRKALDGDEEGFVEQIGELTHNYVRNAVNETVRQNVERDRTYKVLGGVGGGMDMPSQFAPKNRGRGRSRRSGALEYGDVAYARVATGAKTCTYCIMLASRGFAYHSQSTAEVGDHRNCDCLIVPGRHGMDSIDGIDFQAQYDCWREMESLDAYAASHPDEMDAKEVERRKQEIMSRYDGLTLSDEPGEVRKHVGTSGGPNAWYEARERMGKYYDANANAMA